jgi:hypothetical protein
VDRRLEQRPPLIRRDEAGVVVDVQAADRRLRRPSRRRP